MTEDQLQGLSVAHISTVHHWADNRIHYREAGSLAAAGAEVRLIARAAPVDGEHLVPVTALPQRSRLPRLVLSPFTALHHALRSRCRVVHLHDPELVLAIPALRLLGRTVVYDAHEDLPEQVANKPYIHPRLKPAAAVLSRAVLKLANRADLIVAATERVAAAFPPGKTVVVRNYPVLRDAETTAAAISSREKGLVYVGGLSEERGAFAMLDMLLDPVFPAAWRLTVAGPASPELLAEMRRHPAWARVDHHGVLSPADTRDLLLSATVGIVLLRDTPAYRESLPTKMFEYFAAGLPVVASDFPLWREIVTEGDCGQLVDEQDPSSVAGAVRRYADDPELLSTHSANARDAAVNRLNWDHEARTLVKAYSALLRGTGKR